LIPSGVRVSTRQRWLRGAGKAGLASLLLLLWLQVTVLAGSPALHAVMHPDANGLSHRCVVTLVSQGQLVLNGWATLSAAPAVAAQLPVASFVSLLLPAVPHRLAPSRAPPPTVSSPVLAG